MDAIKTINQPKMKKIILATILLVQIVTASAQTARHFVLNMTADSASTLTCYLADKPNERAVVCCPGGGYSHLAIDHEGHAWAPFFNQQGINFFVLKYRMPNGDRQRPISDALKAMRTVRDSASAWGVNPHDVGIMGFSAGGHLASTVCTHADSAARPDFAILFYPVITMGQGTHYGSKTNLLGKDADEETVREYSNELQVKTQVTPPAVILLANDDKGVPPLENGVAYYSAMHRAGNNCAIYVYSSGGHGFGFRTSFPYHQQMMVDLQAWLELLPYGSEK